MKQKNSSTDKKNKELQGAMQARIAIQHGVAIIMLNTRVKEQDEQIGHLKHRVEKLEQALITLIEKLKEIE